MHTLKKRINTDMKAADSGSAPGGATASVRVGAAAGWIPLASFFKTLPPWRMFLNHYCVFQPCRH